MPPDCVFLFEGEWAGSYSVEEAVAYLTSRGIDAELGAELGVGVCLRGRYAGYVVLPFIEEGFGCWGWVARCYNGRPRVGKDGTPRKYLYPFGMPRGDHLDNSKALAEKTDVPFLVVEGKFDAVHHRPNAGASLGHLADGHHKFLQAAARPLVFFGDGDAWEESMMLAAQYRFLGYRAGYIRLPPKTDPDQVPADWALEEAYRCLNRPL
jgi:DNA primase